MSDTNRYFNIWKKLSSQAKLTDKLRTLSNTFSITDSIFQNNLLIFNDSKIENMKKVNAIKKIITRNN